jgi:hypothetical protein
MPAQKFTFVGFAADGAEIEYALPAKFEVCSRCSGTGSHVNPSIDGNGLSREDFDQDPDFEEAYFRGDYDVRCETCKGARVVPVPDLARWTFAQKRAYVKHLRDERDWARDDASEAWLRRAESGGGW